MSSRCTFLCLIVASTASATANVSSETALIRARSYANILGHTLAKDASPRKVMSARSDIGKFQIGWLVVSKDLEIMLDTRGYFTGHVWTSRRELVRTRRSPSYQFNTAVEAWNIAASVLKRLGPTYASFWPDREQAMEGCFRVTFRQRYQGLPAFSQANQATFVIDRVDGRVVSSTVVVKWSYDYPRKKFTLQECAKIAHAKMLAFNKLLPSKRQRPVPKVWAVEQSGVLGYANPNLMWGAKPNVPMFRLRLVYQFKGSGTIWIDAETGKVLGGLEPAIQCKTGSVQH